MDGISAAERQPTNPEGGPKDNETYAEDGSREQGCDRKGGGEEGGFNTNVIDERMVQKYSYRYIKEMNSSISKKRKQRGSFSSNQFSLGSSITYSRKVIDFSPS